MKRVPALIAPIVLALVPFPNAGAYELETHRALTTSALSKSVLQSPPPDAPGLLDMLGLASPSLTFPNELGQNRTITDLVPQSAVLEDGLDASLLEKARVLNHFFDPLTGLPLTYALIAPLGLSSPDWALGSLLGETAAVEVFTLSRARDSMYAALVSPFAGIRNVAFGDVLACLGHVVHHIQDMAQPQHVRNDMHAGENVKFELGGPPSLYEEYVEDTFADAVPAVAPAAITLPTARSYWTNAQQLGMADFTNANFVSAGRNFRGTAVDIQPNALYPLPNGVEATIQAIPWQQLEVIGGEIPSTFPGDSPLPLDLVYFIGTPIKSGGVTVDFNHKTSTYSIWDEHLTTFPPHEPTFALNRYNLIEARNRLLPRATVYSAGLIDHFFRGMWRNDGPTLRVLAVTDTDGQQRLRLTNNTTDTLHAGGTIELWYDRRSDEQRVQLGTSSVLASDLDPGQSVVVDLPLNQLFSDTQLDGQVVVVFRGAMGDEVNGIAARVCNCTAGSMLASSNPDSDCQSLCPCQYLTFQQGNPGTPDGVAITPGLGRSRVQWWDGVGEDANFLGFVDRPIMLLAYPPATEPPPLTMDAARFADGLTVTLFVKPVAGQPAPESLASIFVSFVQPSTTCACGNFGLVVDTALSFGSNGEGGIPAHYSDSSGYTTVTDTTGNERTGTYVSISPALMAECQCAVPTAPLGGLSFSYRSGARTPCASNCDDWTRVAADAVMLCAGELAYP